MSKVGQSHKLRIQSCGLTMGAPSADLFTFRFSPMGWIANITTWQITPANSTEAEHCGDSSSKTGATSTGPANDTTHGPATRESGRAKWEVFGWRRTRQSDHSEGFQVGARHLQQRARNTCLIFCLFVAGLPRLFYPLAAVRLRAETIRLVEIRAETSHKGLLSSKRGIIAHSSGSKNDGTLR